MPLSHYRRRGVLVSSDRESDRVEEQHLRTCVHCQYTWVASPGSGKLRGFCTTCGGDLCGHADCVRRGCMYWERLIELLEAGWPYELLEFAPTRVAVAVTGEVPR